MMVGRKGAPPSLDQPFDGPPKALRKIRIEYDDIGFTRQEQRERVNVGGTHGCPVIDDRSLRVQKTGLILDDLDTRAQKLFIHRLLCPMR